MASQNSKGKIRGKLNNIIYRTYKDKQIMQVAPARVRQTLATKLSALEFGLAATHAKAMRGVFHNIYELYDGNMHRRLTAAIAACIRTSPGEPGERGLHTADLSHLKGFSFNTEAQFEKLVAVRPLLEVAPNGIIQFQLPPFDPSEDLVYPSDLFKPNATFGIYVVAFNFVTGYVQVIDYAGFDAMGNERELREITWTCRKALPKDYMVMVLLGLRYFSLNWLNQRVQTTSKDYYPTIVLEAFHVTDEMAALGIEAGLDPPAEDDLVDLETFATERLKGKVAKLKTKKTGKTTKRPT